MQLKNIFCDRDGTVIYDKNYLSDPEGVELLPGSLAGLKRLHLAGLKIFLVTNQSGIGRGLFGLKDYEACAYKLEKLLEQGGVSFTGSAFCPHDPADPVQACLCRKPGPGMWNVLSAAHGLLAEESVMIGDKAEDVAFGRKLGFALTILVLTGKGEKTAHTLGWPRLKEGMDVLVAQGLSLAPGLEQPDAAARNLAAAADYILQRCEPA